jgi:hypothetical protein
MRFLINRLILGAAALVSVPAWSEDFQWDDRYKISLSVDGHVLPGSRELGAKRAHPLPQGANAQLRVKVTGPDGKAVDYTGSSRLHYETFDCFSITAGGVLGGLTPKTCSVPQYPEFWILFRDEKGNPIAFNEYRFDSTSVRKPAATGSRAK